MHHLTLPVLAATLLGLAACATGQRFDNARYDAKSHPSDVAENPEFYTDAAFLWGGVIVNSSNTQNGTQIEVLSYPLASSQQPDTDRTPNGRFLVIDERYLETLDYAPGRLLTVGGTLSGTRSGQIGEADYVYPVIRPDGLRLWPKDSQRNDPQFHIGIGAVFGR
ncbi:MAG: Slp family lipoprotein [Gammaproteobacteria bacterium]